jgi:type IV secretory pathway VirB10-like protein
MSDEQQHIDPALLGDNPAGMDPSNSVNGPMNLTGKPRGIKKINKKGLMVVAGILGGAAIVASTTFNGTGSAVKDAATEAVANQGRGNKPAEVRRDNLWYADVSDEVATGEPGDDMSPAPGSAPAGGAGRAPQAGAGTQAVPDLTGKAINPITAATAPRTATGVYQPGAQGGEGAAPQQLTPEQQRRQQAEQLEQQRKDQAEQLRAQLADQANKAGLAAAGFSDRQGAQPPAVTQQDRMQGAPAAAAPMAGFGGQQQREDDPNKQIRKEQFLQAQGQVNDPEYSPSRKTAARSPYELKAGSIIPGVLISGLNSDAPGEVIGQVRENVYDSKDGRFLLIPQGSRLIGVYDSQVAYGQKRVVIAWSRVQFQDGSSFNLKGMPGADMSGYAGFSDKVDNHYTKIFGSSVLLSLISAGVQLSQPNNGGGNNNNQPSASQTVGAALGQQLGQTGMNITQKNLNIQPTLEIRPGYRFNIMVTADMILPPVTK